MLSAAAGKHWAVFPLVGWGIGLLAHGAAVFLLGRGSALRERMVHAERERLLAAEAARR